MGGIGLFTHSKDEERVSLHSYNEQYGVISDPEAEEMLEREELVQQNPIEVEIPNIDDPDISLELKDDPDCCNGG